jgi:predicted AlkP superfamily phosphohydrolase/phosphomutase
MTRPRVLMIGLDGFELSIAERLRAEGRLPNLARLGDGAARVLLDHGAARRTGLAWEHVSSGLSPEDAGIWSAVDFDAKRYEVRQRMAPLPPFTAMLDCRTVVFDPPYFDLTRAPGVEGLVSWGAHDPGTAPASRPDGLLDEAVARFGTYPAEQYIYGMVWQSPEATGAMGEGLVRAVELRSAVAQWLFAERLPEWQLGYLVVSEFHSVSEACWHGVDAAHPLHALPSAAPARAAVESVYEAADRMVGELAARFPDATLVLFNLHGMGANSSDTMGMVLLPELLHRHAFGSARLRVPARAEPGGVPLIPATSDWSTEVDRALPLALRRKGPVRRRVDALRNFAARRGAGGRASAASIDWMPAARYRRYWPRMRAFALPAYYDGQIRINLQGRESRGIVALRDYDRACDEIETLVRECRDARTGEPVVATVERAPRPDPTRSDATHAASDADLLIVWKGAPLGIVHPRLGTIGPIPYRRTGGHTGGAGFAHVVGEGVRPGAHGLRSAFDVVPTVVDMLGGSPTRLSGESFRSLIEL